jgi:hypothetical protein
VTPITKELEAEGYIVNLRSANEEAKLIDFEGWEHVIIERDGTRFRLKIHDHPVVGGYLVLVKKRSATWTRFSLTGKLEPRSLSAHSRCGRMATSDQMLKPIARLSSRGSLRENWPKGTDSILDRENRA